MSPFKINFLKLLRSTAMTLLFIPGVSAMMQDEGDGREEYKHSMAPSSSHDRGASTSSPSLLFIKSEPNFLGQTYSRYHVENTKQYEQIDMPQAPVVHPYTMQEDQERTNFSMPSFSYAARLSAGELDPNLFPALSEAQETLQNLGIPLAGVDFFYVVQNDPWNNGPWFYRDPETQELVETKRLLRPQSWAFPEAPNEIESAYSQAAKINVAIFSPNNDIALSGPSEGVIHSHNGISLENPNGSPTVVSSGPAFPMISGLEANKTSFFVSTVVIPDTKKAAVTFHTILDDSDFDLLQRTEINTLPELQNWLGELFQSKYGVAPDSSSPYSKWTTSAGPSSSGPAPAPAPSSSSSSSTPVSAPAVPALELDAREFHMGKRNDYLATGFSAFEGSHRWTVGKEATISFSDMTPRPSHVSFLNTGGFVTAGHPQHLTVKMNGVVVDQYEYTSSNNNHTIDVPLPQVGPAEIEFEIPDAASPSDLGINPDKRELGILFREVNFKY